MKTAVVTGAGRGLGREIAMGLATKGFSVLVTDIDEASAAETARLIGESAWSMRQDVRDAAFHHEVARAANQRGSLELWVNNAGVLYAGGAWEHTDEEVGRMVDINVLGMIWGARAAVEAIGATKPVFLVRRSKVGEDSAVKVWGYPFVPLFFLISSLVLMVFNYVNRPMESSAALLTILFIVIGPMTNGKKRIRIL